MCFIPGKRIYALLLLYLTTLASTAHAALTIIKMHGFCTTGVFPTTQGKELLGKRQAWGSYCEAGDQTTGELTTSCFKAPDRMRIYLAGYPNHQNLELALVDVNSTKRLKLKPIVMPGEKWQFSDFDIPKDWRGRTVRLHGIDWSAIAQGWFAFSEPTPAPSDTWHWLETVALGGRTLLHLLLGVLPCACALLIAVRYGVREPLALALIGLVMLAVVGYFAFWAWFLSPRCGRVTGFLLPIIFLALSFKVGWGLSGPEWKLVRSILPPVGLTLSTTLLIVFACFVYGGLDNAGAAARNRFAEQMPGDNDLPFVFASGLIRGSVPSPMTGDWLSSDRPPLQTGMFLAHMPYVIRPRALDYTIIGISLQSLWVFSLWIFLAAHNLDRRLIALTLGVCLFSGFTFSNSVYVWPKLLAAAYTIAGASVLLGNRLESLRNRPLGLVLAAALITFGFLSHGGTLFSILGLLFAILILRRIPNFRSCCAALATVTVLYSPWLLYQKFVDPPGDRLLKWHIAGTIDVTPQPFAKLLIQNYQKLTWQQLVKNKTDNFATVLGHEADLLRSFADTLKGIVAQGELGSRFIAKGSQDVRNIKEFHFLPELGILALGLLAIPAGLVFKLRASTWRFSLLVTGWVVLTILNWCVLMYVPRSTVLHQGSYAIVLLGYTACLSAAWGVAPRFAIALGLLHIFINFVYYGPLLHVSETGYLVEDACWRGMLVFTALLASIVVYQLLQIAKSHQPELLMHSEIQG
jgi:hypothetical protein